MTQKTKNLKKLISKKNREDLDYLRAKKHLKPDKKFDIEGTDYSNVSLEKAKRAENDNDNFYRYDQCFSVLYDSNFYYTEILIFIDKMHHKYGYMVPIIPSGIANTLNIPLQKVLSALHLFARKKIIFQYEQNIIRIITLMFKLKILTKMQKRHPSIASNKQLGYKLLN